MAIPIEKLLSNEDNRYEFSVAAMHLVDKLGGTELNGEKIDSWKIVSKILKDLLNEEFNYIPIEKYLIEESIKKHAGTGQDIEFVADDADFGADADDTDTDKDTDKEESL